MTLQRIIILTLLFLLPHSCLLPSNDFEPKDIHKIKFDSLKTAIKLKGWNNTLLESFRNYLLFTEYDINNVLNEIAGLPANFQSDYLRSLILKRQKRYKEMYSLLFKVLKNNPDFIPFYDDLLFAASATKNVSGLLSELKNTGSYKKNYAEYLRAMIDYSKGNYLKALGRFQNLVKEESTNRYLLYHLSYAYRNTGDYPEALKRINEAIENSTGDNFFLAEAFLAKGSLFFLSGNYSETFSFYRRAYELAKKTANKFNEAKSLVDLGIINDQNGIVEKARQQFSEALSIAEDSGFEELSAFGNSEQGVSYSFTGELLKAKDSYLKSYRIFKKLGNNLRISLLSENIAKLYLSQFNYVEAMRLYNDGIKYAGDNKRALAINLLGLADVYANLSNYSKALEYYNKAKEISAQIKDLVLESDVNSGLGSLNFNLGNYKSAYDYFKKANELGKNSRDTYIIADTYHNLGLTNFQLGNFNNSELNYRESIDISAKNMDVYTQAISMIDLAYLYLNSSKDHKAITLINEVKKTSSNYSYLTLCASVLEGMILERDGSYSKAESVFKKVLPEIKSLNEPNLLIQIYYLLAGIYEKINKYDQAEAEYRNSIKLIEKTSKSLYSKDQVQISYFSSKDNVYDSYIRLLIKEKKYDKAFLLVDRSRSRNTIQNLFNLKMEAYKKSGESIDKLYDYEWILNSGIYSKAETDSITEIYSRYQSELLKDNPQLSELFTDEFDYSLKYIQDKLDTNEYVISYFFSGNSLFGILAGRNEFKNVNLHISLNELENLLAGVSPYFRENNEDVFYNQDLFSFNSEKSYELYKKILSDLLYKIPKDSKIIFSPCPELTSVPLEFIVTKYDSSGSPFNYQNNDFLINHYEISYTPSVRLYINEKYNILKSEDKFLIVGNPRINYKSNGFSERRGMLEASRALPRGISLLPLKYSEDEVNEIRTLINAHKVFISNEATETNFKENAEYSKIIHLSTHSFLINNQPVIFLSNYNDSLNDGFLEASEIVKLKLNSDLVVLSSCNSGLGKLDKSEGILGMTKAFYQAGVKSVIVSLWPVNDKFTSNLMTLFYKNISNGMNKSEALRKAKISFIKKYSPNPYYWSAFVLSGNTSKISVKKGQNTTNLLQIIFVLIILALITVYIRNKKLKRSALSN